MMELAKLTATFLGIGYIQKGAGTIAALMVCIAWYYFPVLGSNTGLSLSLIAFQLIVGVWSASRVEAIWGEDSNKVVIDETLGMSLTLFLIPINFWNLLWAFLLFRFFDILKPLFIRKAENLPSGWGVMADDVLAGVYANLIMQLLLYFQLVR
ncbi:MAG TPA: phosphatidylglycerophosphatase A [Flavisolibacter sp.]|jgi:phosphatidylglycerophosphatase A|nr:phosphatidylglycerophosphatase A [Flavisolibacter sp.]